MKTSAVFVTSLDGKITHGDNPHPSSWASPEDQQWFKSLIKKHKVLIMGRRTWEASKGATKLTSDKIRIVITSRPERYKKDTVEGQLEFTSASARALLKRFSNQDILILGGAEIFTRFLKEHLIDILYLTLEPKLLGKGRSLVAEEHIDTSLELVDQKKLNSQGTLLLTYRVKKDRR